MALLGLLSWHPIVVGKLLQHLNIGYRYLTSTETRPSNELLRLDGKTGQQDSNPRNGRQADTPIEIHRLFITYIHGPEES